MPVINVLYEDLINVYEALREQLADFDKRARWIETRKNLAKVHSHMVIYADEEEMLIYLKERIESIKATRKIIEETWLKEEEQSKPREQEQV
jgi:hypothetical protein